MESLKAIKKSLASEINQNETIQKNLLLRILTSRRLLIDHMDVLEESLPDVDELAKPADNQITFLKTTSALASSFVVFVHLKQNFRYLIPSLVGLMPIVYVQKLVNVARNEKLEAKLANFTKSLDSFESAIRRNKTFLQESQHIKSSASLRERHDRTNKTPRTLIKSIKNVIDALYTFVKFLEEDFEVSAANYSRFENLQTCELYQINLEEDFKLSLIKDFFNVFAYIQSQVLLRFALITVSNVEDSKFILRTKIEEVTDVINSETEAISKFMKVIDNVSKAQDFIQKHLEKEISTAMPKELRELRNGSIKFTAKALSVAVQCQRLEELILKFTENPEKREISEILTVMREIETEMSLNTDEHQRISFLFQKFLNIETEVKVQPEQNSDEAAGDGAVVKLIEAEATPQSDDFFFVDGNAGETDADDSGSSNPENIYEVDTKLAKKYFKPVLAQLKERIVVIDEDMKEREKKVLKAKGIEIKEEPEMVKGFDEDSGSDDERERKRRKNENKFRENREFLESKQPINIFASRLPPPPKSAVLEEEFLE